MKTEKYFKKSQLICLLGEYFFCVFLFELEYFLNKSYDTALHEMKIFAVSEERIAILTRKPHQKIISWPKKNVTNNNQLKPLVKVYNTWKESWVEFIKNKYPKFGFNSIRKIGNDS